MNRLIGLSLFALAGWITGDSISSSGRRGGRVLPGRHRGRRRPPSTSWVARTVIARTLSLSGRRCASGWSSGGETGSYLLSDLPRVVRDLTDVAGEGMAVADEVEMGCLRVRLWSVDDGSPALVEEAKVADQGFQGASIARAGDQSIRLEAAAVLAHDTTLVEGRDRLHDTYPARLEVANEAGIDDRCHAIPQVLRVHSLFRSGQPRRSGNGTSTLSAQ
ncbi:MAG: hypothetical protein ACRDPT_12140 [Streptomycetales bacterium]